MQKGSRNRQVDGGRKADGRTFALWRVLAAVSEDVDLVDGSVRLEKLLQLLLRPRARDLSHEHLDGVWIRLVRMLQRAVHLSGCAVTVGETEGEEARQQSDHQSLQTSQNSDWPPAFRKTLSHRM